MSDASVSASRVARTGRSRLPLIEPARDRAHRTVPIATGIEITSTTTFMINRAGGRIVVEAANLAIGTGYGGSDVLTGASITTAALPPG